MIFDKFCGIAERHCREAVPLLRQAHLFEFPDDPAQKLPKSYDEDTVQLLTETFFLPFPVVAVEDPISCILLFDSQEEQRGVGDLRYFAECAPIRPALESDSELGPEDRKYLERILGFDAYSITFGKIETMILGVGGDKPVKIKGCVQRAMVASTKSVFADGTSFERNPVLLERMTSAALRNAKTAVEELFYFNTPNRFVVERTPIRNRKPNPNLEILRSDSRSRYILLTPEEIREKIGRTSEVCDDPQRKSPAPHHRRRHFRKLSSEKFTSARGKILTIPASWIGPSEGSDSRNRYKICLDL